MADTLGTLVRVAKHKVERAQEALGLAEKKVLQLAQFLQANEAARTQALQAVTQVEGVSERLDAARYEARLKQLSDKLKKDLAEAEALATECRRKLTDEYAAQERYALLAAQEQKKIALRKANKQQEQLDDISGRLRR